MITFKQFLNEDDDFTHTVSEAVEVYLKNCKQWQNVEEPLYRFSEEKDGQPHAVRSRSPRQRLTDSRGGTKPIQDYIFSQPGWEKYPPRSKSIFCSTSKESALGGTNLMIYPFDDTKIGVVNGYDLNLMDILAGIPPKYHDKISHLSMKPFVYGICDAYVMIIDPTAETVLKNFVKYIDEIKAKFTKNGKFDETANGDDEVEERYDNAPTRDRAMIEIIAKYVPDCFRPENMGFKLVTPATIDLSGKAREVWFSGRYLSIPKAYYTEFVQEVKKAQR
jgi:hypothetical protein